MLKNLSFRRPISFIFGILISLSILFFAYSHLLTNQLIEQGEAIYNELESTAFESYRVIASLNQLGFTQCTQENLLKMRKAQFDSNNIKDIGFFENGSITCTTGAGLLEHPIKEGVPDFILNGHNYWFNKALVTFDKTVSGIIIQNKNYNIVLSFQTVLNEYISQTNYEVISKYNNKLTHLYGQKGIYKNQSIDEKVYSFTGLFSHSIELCGKYGGICVAVQQVNFIELKSIPLLIIFLIFLILSGISGLHLTEVLYRYFHSTKRRVKVGLYSECFKPNYQAIVDLKTGRVIGCELLARFEDRMGVLYPDEFIPVVSELNLSWLMTECLMLKAMDDFADLQSSDKPFYLSINIFPKDINNGDILKGIALLNKMDPNLDVCFEITEDEELHFDQLGDTLAALAQSPIKISIDDFGTGYSNLSQLKLLDIDTLKIDKSFVDEVESGSIRSTLIPNIVSIANKLNANIIAEGVENQLQVNELLKMNISFGQGWHYVKALPIVEFKTYLHDHSDFEFKKKVKI